MMFVLDASAVLAFLFDEGGGKAVEPHLSSAIMCAPNVTEVVTRLIDKGRSGDDAIKVFVALGVRVVSFDGALALRAGAMREIGRKPGLSLGDRACLALAEREGFPVLTGDREWSDLDLAVDIRLIR